MVVDREEAKLRTYKCPKCHGLQYSAADKSEKTCIYCGHLGTVLVDEVAKMTNYELIKSMSIEEMAVTIMCPNESGLAEIECDQSDKCNCCQCCLDWLKEEAE